MDIQNILMLLMVKGVGPAFIKKHKNRLAKEQSCEQIVNEFKPDELENINTYSQKAAARPLISFQQSRSCNFLFYVF